MGRRLNRLGTLLLPRCIRRCSHLIGGPNNTKYLALLAIFHGKVVKLEDAYQNLDNQPLTQLPCVFRFQEPAPERDPRSRCRPYMSVLRDARSSARAARDP
jgi:hypothetical protein